MDRTVYMKEFRYNFHPDENDYIKTQSLDESYGANQQQSRVENENFYTKMFKDDLLTSTYKLEICNIRPDIRYHPKSQLDEDCNFLKSNPGLLLKNKKALEVFKKGDSNNIEEREFNPTFKFNRIFGQQESQEFSTPLTTYQRIIGKDGADRLVKRK